MERHQTSDVVTAYMKQINKDFPETDEDLDSYLNQKLDAIIEGRDTVLVDDFKNPTHRLYNFYNNGVKLGYIDHVFCTKNSDEVFNLYTSKDEYETFGSEPKFINRFDSIEQAVEGHVEAVASLRKRELSS